MRKYILLGLCILFMLVVSGTASADTLCEWASPLAVYNFTDNGYDCSGNAPHEGVTNRTFTGVGTPQFNANGTTLDGSNYLINTNQTFPAFRNTSFTMCVNVSGGVINGVFFSHEDGGGNDGVRFAYAGDQRFRGLVTNQNVYTTNDGGIFGKYYEVCLAKNGTDMTLFTDGQYNNSATANRNATPDSLFTAYVGKASFGLEFQGTLNDLVFYPFAFDASNASYKYAKSYEDIGAAGPTENTTNVSATFPLNNTHYNTNTLNINLTVNSSKIFNCTLYIDLLLNQTHTQNAAGNNQFINFNLTFDDSEERSLNYFVNCFHNETQTANSTNVTFFIDNVFPGSMTWVTPASANTTVITQSEFMYSNITISDTNLYSYYYNISYLNKTSIWNFSNISLTGNVAYNITDTVNMSNHSGTFLAIVKTCDGHTDNVINFDFVRVWNNELQFDDIKIYLETLTDTSKLAYHRKEDRYEFDFTSKTSSTSKNFIVESPFFIDILHGKTGYEGHLVTGNKWIDFEMAGTTAKVTRINDYKVRVTITSLIPRTFWDFDSIGELNCITEEKKFTVLGESESSKNRALENEPVNFYLNVTHNPDVFKSITAIFVYNDTMYTPTSTNTSSLYQFSHSMNAPINRSLAKNYTYYWNYTLRKTATNDSYNTTWQNQSVFKVLVDNCSLYSTYVLNVTLFSDVTDGAIPGDWDVFMEYWKHSVYYNYSVTMAGIGNVSFCVFPEWANYTTDTQIQYTADEFETFDHYLDSAVLSNVTSLLDLYVVNSTTTVTFTVIDQDYNEIEDAYITVMKYDIGSGSYKTTSILKTDSDGVALGEIVLNSVWYKFIINYEGALVLETSPVKITTTSKTFRINLLSDVLGNFDTYMGIAYSLTFTNATKNFKFTWSDPSGLMHYGCLKVVKESVTGTTLINDTCVSSTASEILINIGTDVGTATYVATGYFKFDDIFTAAILSYSYDRTWETYGDMGAFLSLLIIVALVMVGIWSPMASIVLMIIGFFFTNVLGLFHMGWEYFIALAILGGIAIFKMSRQDY